MPSISTAISNLETELGVELFIPHHAQGISLTPAGRRLLIEAKSLLAQASHLYDVVSEVTELVRGQLSVGCMVPLAPTPEQFSAEIRESVARWPGIVKSLGILPR